jgi:hypothetical protein
MKSKPYVSKNCGNKKGILEASQHAAKHKALKERNKCQHTFKTSTHNNINTGKQ